MPIVNPYPGYHGPCIYCSSDATANWWSTDEMLQENEEVALVCAWCHYEYGQGPFNSDVDCYRPTETPDAFNIGLRYPPRIPGAPGNAGATPHD